MVRNYLEWWGMGGNVEGCVGIGGNGEEWLGMGENGGECWQMEGIAWE